MSSGPQPPWYAFGMYSPTVIKDGSTTQGDGGGGGGGSGDDQLEPPEDLNTCFYLGLGGAGPPPP